MPEYEITCEIDGDDQVAAIGGVLAAAATFMPGAIRRIAITVSGKSHATHLRRIIVEQSDGAILIGCVR